MSYKDILSEEEFEVFFRSKINAFTIDAKIWHLVIPPNAGFYRLADGIDSFLREFEISPKILMPILNMLFRYSYSGNLSSPEYLRSIITIFEKLYNEEE